MRGRPPLRHSLLVRLLANRIASPLHLIHTYFDPGTRIRGRHAHGYVVLGGRRTDVTNWTTSFSANITGGTGKNAGATGTETATGNGQTLTSDAAGHGLAWFVVPFTDTITTKEHE